MRKDIQIGDRAFAFSLQHRLGLSQGGIAATEFALILPFILVGALGMLEAVNRLEHDRKLKTMASTMAQLISRQTTPFTAGDAHFVWDSAMMIFPKVLTEERRRGMAWWDVISPTYTSIEFKLKDPNCKKSCAYDAYVMWSAGRYLRKCGKQNGIDPKSSPNRQGIPSNLFGPGTIIVVDVEMDYNPLVPVNYAGRSKFHKVSYISPRYKPRVEAVESSAEPGFLVVCK
jgi:hypothetical protein